MRSDGNMAVGRDIDSPGENFADGQEPNKTGVIYYLARGRLRRAMTGNVWEKVDAARELIRKMSLCGRGIFVTQSTECDGSHLIRAGTAVGIPRFSCAGIPG